MPQSGFVRPTAMRPPVIRPAVMPPAAIRPAFMRPAAIGPAFMRPAGIDSAAFARFSTARVPRASARLEALEVIDRRQGKGVVVTDPSTWLRKP
ncbi:hypothetical protein ABZ738_01360 [Micromonospora sp. NPDC047793]|uniref:hypothetical protein n=1 Tax=unclassified Micromonospora TaxID=2617518 RepID=UPI0031B9C587